MKTLQIIALFFASSWACDIKVGPTDDIHAVADALAANLTTSWTDDSTFDICFQAGVTYHLTRPIVLDERHNGAKVTWRTNDGLGATFSAGLPLTKWNRCNDGIHCPWADWEGVWVHAVSDIPNATASEASKHPLCYSMIVCFAI